MRITRRSLRTNFKKKHYTRAERIFGRLLQEYRIPFRTKVIVAGREVDFLIGNLAIEIDGHTQDGSKNKSLADLGYIPIHFNNKDIINNRELIKNKLYELYRLS